METTSSLDFGWLARQLSDASRSAGLKAPGFKSPPRISGRNRTVRRFPGGNFLVSVATKGRGRDDIIDDMIEGIVVANGLSDNIAVMARRTLLRALATQPTHHAA